MNDNVKIYDRIKRFYKNHQKVLICILIFFLIALYLNYINNVNEKEKNVLSIFKILDSDTSIALNGTYYGGDLDLESHSAKFEFDTGDVYDGNWNKTNFDGNGKYEFSKIGYYEGDFNKGVRSGNGKFVWTDGSVYDGQWDNDHINGEGLYSSVKGVSLKGTFIENNFVHGNLIYKKDGNVYKYKIENGIPSGKITIEYDDGSKYIGSYKKNKLSGIGTLKYYNGDIYKGRFNKGKKSGYGKYTWKNGAYYKGDWENDKMNGNGKYVYHFESEGKYLIGSFKNNKPTGVCIYKNKDLEKYKTTWKNGTCIKVRGTQNE